MQVDTVPPISELRGPAVGNALRFSWFGRLVLIGGGLLLLATFVVAARLTPDERGYGTHRQLAWLAPCGFLQWSGLPCPSCGMTTAWAHMVRGQWGAAWRANPFGCELAVAVALIAPWCLISGIRGRWIFAAPSTGMGLRILVGLGSLGVLHWIVRIIGTS